jgi:ubiquinone biosynthesis protein COQ4
VLNRPPPSYDGHVPLTRIERGALAVGSALGAIVNPRRAGTFLQTSLPYTIADFELIDLVAALGEVTAGPFIEYLRDAMLLNETGRRILRDRPRITSKTMPVEELRRLPENTVGQIYAKWLEDYHMSPEGRDDVKYIDDEECAYVMQRYRECHDIYHAILGIPAFWKEKLP